MIELVPIIFGQTPACVSLDMARVGMENEKRPVCFRHCPNLAHPGRRHRT